MSFVWGYKLKTAGTGKTMLDGLQDVVLRYWKPGATMTDSGSHFDNEEVRRYCEAHGIQHIKTPAYTPWTNSLVENANKILLERLRRLCAPNLDHGEEMEAAAWEKWPDYLKEAIQTMNDRILLAIGFTLRELIWGRREMASAGDDTEIPARTESDIEHHLILTDMLCSQGYTEALNEAANRKRQFNGKARPVTFKTGDQVQVYDSKLDMTFNTRAKLLPRWSPPRRVIQKHLNSYTLSTLGGKELLGTFHARRLRHYTLLQDKTAGEGDQEVGERRQTDDEEDFGQAIRGLFEERDATRAHITEIGGGYME